MPAPPGQGVFQLRITLVDVEPAVWRRLLVPASVRLPKLHAMFQAAMGWTDSHLHRFDIGDQSFGMRFDDEDDVEIGIDETDVTVLRAIGEHKRFSYEYDLGDGWVHDIVVEDVRREARGLKHAVCLAGENACPPEDCGGADRYASLLEALADPGHENHDDLVDWIGGSFDPRHLDLVDVNVALQHVR